MVEGKEETKGTNESSLPEPNGFERKTVSFEGRPLVSREAPKMDRMSGNQPISAKLPEPAESRFESGVLVSIHSRPYPEIAAPKMESNYTCHVCRRKERSLNSHTGKKPSIVLIPSWTSIKLTVYDSGEHCLPCPLCETTPEGNRAITHWDHPQTRLHKRLRQHVVRHHQKRLHELFTPDEVTSFYADARRLRCELIHGPKAPTAVPLDEVPNKAEETVSPTRRRARNISAKESRAIELPPTFIDWLRDELRPDSVSSYAGVIRTYLHWIGLQRESAGALPDVWDIDAVTSFIQSLKGQVAPSTIFNYLCALQSAQRFVQLRGEANPTQNTVLQFSALMRQASKQKAMHHRSVSEKKRTDSVTLLEVKQRVLGNPDLLHRYQSYAEICQSGEILSQSQFQWATGYAIFNLQASNFKRNGNVRKIPFESTLDRIQTALRRGKTCEIAVADATKTGGTEVFSILKRQRLEVLLSYGTHIRPSAMGSGNSPSFFVNSVGKAISKASPFITALGKSVGLPHLTIKDLRSRIETEAALREKNVDRKAIAGHLAHTEGTRDRHYLLTDRRRSREAARDIEKLIDGAEPADDSDSDTELSSPSTVSRASTDDSPAKSSEKDSTSDSSPTHRVCTSEDESDDEALWADFDESLLHPGERRPYSRGEATKISSPESTKDKPDLSTCSSTPEPPEVESAPESGSASLEPSALVESIDNSTPADSLIQPEDASTAPEPEPTSTGSPTTDDAAEPPGETESQPQTSSEEDSGNSPPVVRSLRSRTFAVTLPPRKKRCL